MPEKSEMPISHIWIVSPSGYPHSASFLWQARALMHSFDALGYEVNITINPEEITGTALVLGANLLPFIKKPTAPLIIYNLEQIEVGSPWMTDKYIELLEHYPVWDYTDNNVSKLGIHPKICGVGYSPVYTHIQKSLYQDIPILFFGSMNDRRQKILKELGAYTAFNVYGNELDNLIARSKLVVNIHYYESKVFEITRCSYLFSNYVPIVSEIGMGDEQFRETDGFVPYENIVDKCQELLSNDTKRLQNGIKGFELFSRTSQTEMLKAVL